MSVCRGQHAVVTFHRVFLRMGVVVIVIRVVIEILFGQRGVPGHVLFNLPHLPLALLGGSGERRRCRSRWSSMLDTFIAGCGSPSSCSVSGAADSLASPYRLLRSLPAVLYETGVAVTVALAFTPSLFFRLGWWDEAAVQRGIPIRGVRGLHGVAVPVLEGALDRSLQLATSIDDLAGTAGEFPWPGLPPLGQWGHDRVGCCWSRSGSTASWALRWPALFGLGLPILAVGGRPVRYGPGPGRPAVGSLALSTRPLAAGPTWVVVGSGVAASRGHVRRACAQCDGSHRFLLTFGLPEHPAAPDRRDPGRRRWSRRWRHRDLIQLSPRAERGGSCRQPRPGCRSPGWSSGLT